MKRIFLVTEMQPVGTPVVVTTDRTADEIVAFLGGGTVVETGAGAGSGTSGQTPGHPSSIHDIYNPTCKVWVDFVALSNEFKLDPPSFDEEQPWSEGRYASLADLREKFRQKAS